MTVGRSLWEPPILVQRQWSVLDDTLHNEGGAEALDAWEGGEVVVLDLLEGGQVGGDDAQKVVGLTEEPLGLPDVGDGGDSLFERLDGGAVSAAHDGWRPKSGVNRWAWFRLHGQAIRCC